MKPKWLVAYSDNTCLIYLLATCAHTSSAYSMCVFEYNTLQSKDASDALIYLLMGK